MDLIQFASQTAFGSLRSSPSSAMTQQKLVPRCSVSGMFLRLLLTESATTHQNNSKSYELSRSSAVVTGAALCC